MKKFQPSDNLSLHSSQALLKNSLLKAVKLNLKQIHKWWIQMFENLHKDSEVQNKHNTVSMYGFELISSALIIRPWSINGKIANIYIHYSLNI